MYSRKNYATDKIYAKKFHNSNFSLPAYPAVKWISFAAIMFTPKNVNFTIKKVIIIIGFSIYVTQNYAADIYD